jgi:hypothetical protein
MLQPGLYHVNVSSDIETSLIVRINIGDRHDVHGITNYYSVDIGHRTQFCLNIEIYINGKNRPHVMTKVPIVDRRMKDMIYLAAAIIREVSDETQIEFKDNSQFYCTIAHGVIRPLPLSIYHFMFKGKTWYEETFGAKLKNEGSLPYYKKIKDALLDPTLKYHFYETTSDYLRNEIQPIYDATSTLAEFFQEIAKKYGDQKCRMIYRWLGEHYYSIMGIIGEQLPLVDLWIIDINNLPSITYSARSITKSGSFTRKNRGKNTDGRKITRRRVVNIPNIDRDAILYDDINTGYIRGWWQDKVHFMAPMPEGSYLPCSIQF